MRKQLTHGDLTIKLDVRSANYTSWHVYHKGYQVRMGLLEQTYTDEKVIWHYMHQSTIFLSSEKPQPGSTVESVGKIVETLREIIQKRKL